MVPSVYVEVDVSRRIGDGYFVDVCSVTAVSVDDIYEIGVGDIKYIFFFVLMISHESRIETYQIKRLLESQ